MIFDANGAIAGRLATIAAKTLLKGEDVVVINAEKAVISGDPAKVTQVYRARREMRMMANPEKSAKWPRRPDALLKKIVSGMLPKHSSRGAKALKKFRAYIGVPKEFESQKTEPLKKASSALSIKSISLEKLCAELGWTSGKD